MDHLISAAANNYADNISWGPLKSMASPFCLSAFYYYNADISVTRTKKISLLQRKKERNILSALSLQNEDGVFWDFLQFITVQLLTCISETACLVVQVMPFTAFIYRASHFQWCSYFFFNASSVSVEFGIYFSVSDSTVWQIHAPMSLFFRNS